MSILNELNYEDTTLPNGLKVLTVSSPHLGLFSAELIIKKGYRDELEHQTQWTHLWEHIMATNCQLLPDQVAQDEYLTNNGIKTNAYTSPERVAAFGESSPAEAQKVLTYLFNSIKHPILSEENINREVEIINQEHRQKFINPEMVVYNLSFRSMVAGTTLTQLLGKDYYQLKKPTAKELESFHQSLVNAQDMVLVISGPLSHSEIINLVSPLANDIQSLEKSNRVPEIAKPTKLAIPESTNESKVVVLRWPSVVSTDSLYLAQALFSNYLTGTLSSPLNKKLRLDHHLTYVVDSGYWSRSDMGGFTIHFKSSKPAECLKLVEEVLRTAPADLASTDLQQVIKRRAFLNDRRALLAQPNDLIDWISDDYVFTGKIKKIEDYDRELEAVTTEQMLKITQMFSFPQAHIFSDDPTVG